MPSNWGGEVVDGPGTPTIEFSFVPAYGTFDNLRGRVSHVDPSQYRVAVYIKVAGQWWIKPTFANPLTVIMPNGTWECDVTTGGTDQNATEFIAFLLPSGYDPPLVHVLPQELYDAALDWVSVVRSP